MMFRLSLEWSMAYQCMMAYLHTQDENGRWKKYTTPEMPEGAFLLADRDVVLGQGLSLTRTEVRVGRETALNPAVITQAVNTELEG